MLLFLFLPCKTTIVTQGLQQYFNDALLWHLIIIELIKCLSGIIESIDIADLDPIIL